MSQSSKSLTLARLEDMTLGAFASVPQSSTLGRLVDYLGTFGGNDKFFAIVQYTLKLLVPYLNWRAKLQHGVGRRASPTSSIAPALAKLSGLIGDARMAFNFWGLLLCVRWLIDLERKQFPTRRDRTIERLQAWSLALFYPLDNTAYLLNHDILPSKFTLGSNCTADSVKSENTGLSITLNSGKLSRASCGLWGFYIVLQLFRLGDDGRKLRAQEVSASKSKAVFVDSERAQLRHKRRILRHELVAQTCNLPCAIHWALEKGFFKNSIWVDVLSLIANLASFRSAWLATSPSVPSTSLDSSDEKAADRVTDPDISAPIGLDAGLDEI